MMEKQAYQSSKGRIAKNTLFLYARQVLILAVSLYTSRVILQVLGADDYGIYSLIGGFVALFGVISGAFNIAITRYISFVTGENDGAKLSSLYSTAVWMMLLLGGAITVLVIASGVWYVEQVMVLPPARTEATLYVLVFSAISFYINLLSVPYTALIVAHEKMQAFAYIALAEVVLKLFIVLTLPWIPTDKLIAYAFFTVTTALIVRGLYMVYCRRHFAECRFRRHMDKKLLKDMMSFIQWAFLGNGAVVLKEQGMGIILNLFLGTTINAAAGLATSVNGAVTSFVNNFIQAVQPQITKLYASGQREEMCRLICLSSRFSYFLLFLLSLPLIKNIDYVLSIWLGAAPPYTAIFIVWTLVDSLIVSLMQPLLYGMLAEGHIKAYEIFLTTLYIASLPMAYLILHVELSPVWIYVLIAILRVMILVALIQQGLKYGLRWAMFLRSSLLPAATVTLPAAAFAYWLDGKGWTPVPFFDFCAESALIGLAIVALIGTVGMNRAERQSLCGMIRRKMGLFL